MLIDGAARSFEYAMTVLFHFKRNQLQLLSTLAINSKRRQAFDVSAGNTTSRLFHTPIVRAVN